MTPKLTKGERLRLTIAARTKGSHVHVSPTCVVRFSGPLANAVRQVAKERGTTRERVIAALVASQLS